MKRYYSDLLLLIAALIWGFAFVAQRMGMDYTGPFTYTAVRFTLGCVVLFPMLFSRRFAPVVPQHRKVRNHMFLLQLLLGLLIFGGVSFQQYGLLFTTAGNAGFITGLYVVMVPVAGLFLGHKNHITLWAGVALAATGLWFLSVGEGFKVNPGDYYVLVCAVLWTFHVLIVGYVAPRTDPIRTAFIQFLVCALLSWIVAIGVEEIRYRDILAGAGPILYGGILSVGVAYTLQVVAQQRAHPAYASIILSMESLFAVIGGWLILDEPMTSRIILGCTLMLAGMIAAQNGFSVIFTKKIKP